MTVSERDALTISDAVQLLAGVRVYDSRGRELDEPREYSSNRVRVHARQVDSYGAHFPLFRFLPAGVYGRRRPLFLINGDRVNGVNGSGMFRRSRTPDHQTATRDAIRASGVDSCVIPFTALTGAEIVLDSIRLIHARPDSDWTETRTAETLAGVPRFERRERYEVTASALTLDGVPDSERTVWRELTPAEIVQRDADRAAGVHYSFGYGDSTHGRAPLLPDADGLYRWTESRYRDRSPDADGLYRWTVHVHRLGDCLFSGVREIREPDRPAYPFERSRDNARERVQLESDSSGFEHCSASPDHRHESGAGSACVHCHGELTARTLWRRRARYLSSFDTNEVPPLYFLAEVPRGAGDSVETATDALAPRAVHAAIARGADVQRQGDIFLIGTDLTDADLTARGVRSRARLTMWTRDARARAGETGYSAPLLAADRRELSARARRYWRREWRAAYPAGVAVAPFGYSKPRTLDAGEYARRRAESGELWRALLARQESERRLAPDADALAACARCGAAIGAACEPATRYESGERERGNLARYHRRETLAVAHTAERRALRSRTLAGREPETLEPLRPRTDAGARRRWREIRASYAAEVVDARESLRRAVFANGRPARGYPERPVRVSQVRRAREILERIEQRGPAGVDSLGNHSRAAGRDSYRRAGVGMARELWRESLAHAHERLRPELYGERASANRERVRDAVSIYGTAHTATEVLTLRSGAVYVRGVVRHRPDIERNGDRWRRPDHRPVYLGNGERWYLAVRNAVPRQSERRRRPRRARQLELRTGA